MVDEEFDENDKWQSKSTDVVWQFGIALKELHQTNPWPDLPLLPAAMNNLMTELWDNGFSQTEIREAFTAAIAAMPRYAAGYERRSDGPD